MSLTIEERKAANKALIDEVLKAYPEKMAKRRAKHLGQFEEGKPDCGVKSNIKSLPGVMTIRGCAYAGSKGVVWGPIKDMIHISHGPVGCGQYSWAARRNYYIGATGIDTFVTMQFTSDFQEKDIVFGGDKKLDKIIDEIQELFPLNKGISIQSECPIGLIGDDIEAVSKRKSKEYAGHTIVPVRCEGFRGVSQSLGHHIANDAIRDHVFDKADPDKRPDFVSTPYDVAIIGDYNIGGDAWSSRILLEEMGLRVIAQWSGDGTIAELENTPRARLNVLHCYRSMNYISRHMEEKYGIPWVEYNFFGPTMIEKSLREIAGHFDDTTKEDKQKIVEIMGDDAHMIDDMTPRQMYAMLRDAKADIMLSGGRSQFVALKARMPWMDINQERHHAFAGYEGMVTMVAELDKALFNPMWQQVRAPAPWEAVDPLLVEQDPARLAAEAPPA